MRILRKFDKSKVSLAGAERKRPALNKFIGNLKKAPNKKKQ
jgi:hypothetical protein